MIWALRLKRVFNIAICERCRGPVRIIACIDDPAIIRQILALKSEEATDQQARLPPGRASPQLEMFE